MAVLKTNRSAQWLLAATFTFDIASGDTLANTAGTTVAVGAVVGAQAFDAIHLPNRARVIGGGLTVLTVGNDGGAQTLSVGDSGSATRYLGATNIKAAARTALVPTGFVGAGEDLRITLSNGNGDATAGKVSVDILYLIDGRANEVVTV
jgi:hypothetical protein